VGATLEGPLSMRACSWKKTTGRGLEGLVVGEAGHLPLVVGTGEGEGLADHPALVLEGVIGDHLAAGVGGGASLDEGGGEEGSVGEPES
jgi:hypothetical protein